MSVCRLEGPEALALHGAVSLSDEELAGKLAELIDLVADNLDPPDPQDLRDLAAVALVAARRIDRDAGMLAALDDLYPDPDSPMDGT